MMTKTLADISEKMKSSSVVSNGSIPPCVGGWSGSATVDL